MRILGLRTVFAFTLLLAIGPGRCETPRYPKPANSLAKRAQSTNDTNAQVAFLQTLQAASVASMSCLITLVNMTVNPIGTCLGLTTLADMVVQPPQNASFSDSLTSYLSNVCAASQCTDQQLSDASAQLSTSCASSSKTQLVQVVQAIVDNYTNSYRTLACSVYFNGTATPCLPAALNTSQTANDKDFFNDLVTGTDLDQYQQSVFSQAKCTGCMHEMFKAAVYMIPGMRGNSVTSSFGQHLQNDCGAADGVSWSSVQDQQIPDALQVQQNTASSNAVTYAWPAYSLTMGIVLVVCQAAMVRAVA